jgi:hypothetical protein
LKVDSLFGFIIRNESIFSKPYLILPQNNKRKTVEVRRVWTCVIILSGCGCVVFISHPHLPKSSTGVSVVVVVVSISYLEGEGVGVSVECGFIFYLPTSTLSTTTTATRISIIYSKCSSLGEGKRIFLFILRFSTFSYVKKLFKHVENPCVKTPYVRFSCLLRAVDKLQNDLMNEKNKIEQNYCYR